MFDGAAVVVALPAGAGAGVVSTAAVEGIVVDAVAFTVVAVVRPLPTVIFEGSPPRIPTSATPVQQPLRWP